MNPDTGDEAEDWFAKFEREAREAARKREGEPEAAPPAAQPPQLSNPFDSVPPPVAPPPVAPPAAQPPAAQPIAPWEPPPVSPLEPAEPAAWDVPTRAAPRIEPEPTQAMSAVPDEPTQALVPAPLRPPGSPEPGSALDDLFGDDRFQEYDATLGPDPSNAPFQNRGRSKELVHVPGGDGAPPPSRGFGTPQKVLAGIGGGLLAVLLLIGLFLLGTRLPDLLGPAPAVATPTPTPTPTMTALPIGPVEPGTYDWDELLGGECLEPYDAATGAWAAQYTVVDCAEPHGAQMVFRAWFPAEADPDDPTAEPVRPSFPGAEVLATQISLLCSAPGVVDLAAAGAYNDAQIQGSYPVTEEQWDADPSYFCFVSRSSGEPLSGSVAVPPAAPVIP